MATMSLCNACHRIDIRSMVVELARRKAQAAQEENKPEDHEDEDPDDLVPPFKLHEGIEQVKLNSIHCPFCKFIWGSWEDPFFMKDCDSKWMYKEPDQGIYIRVLGLIGNDNCPDETTYIAVTVGPFMRGLTLRLEICLIPEEPIPNLEDDLKALLLTEVCEDPGSQLCLSIAQNWLTSCRVGHEHCSRAQKKGAVLPTRVIEVGDEVTSPSLYMTEGEFGTWVALSYCWGGHSDFILTQETRESLTKGRPLSEFPATIRDAVLITRNLGIKYLWIDSLCILQDSAEDWNLEYPKMYDIYSDAVLTIAAAATDMVTDGIFRRRETSLCKLPWRVPTTSEDELPAGYVQIRASKYYQENGDLVNESRWNSRGWTLQECVLSCRMLTYTSSEMVWNCCSLLAYEHGREAKELFPKKHAHPDLNIYRYKDALSVPRETRYCTPITKWRRDWYDIINRFSYRALTKRSDLLPAIAGLARILQNFSNDEYCAGIWRGDLIGGLLWHPSFNTEYDGDTESLFDTQGPSWNWTSCFTTVDFLKGRMNFLYGVNTQDLPGYSTTDIAKIEDISFEYAAPDIYGSIQGGKLIITGPSYKMASLDPPPQDGPEDSSLQNALHSLSITSTPYSPLFQSFLLSQIQQNQQCSEFSIRHKPYLSQHFLIMQLARQVIPESHSSSERGGYLHLLVLESVEKESHAVRDEVYRRVSLVRLREMDYEGSNWGSGIQEEHDYEVSVAKEMERFWDVRTVTVI